MALLLILSKAQLFVKYINEKIHILLDFLHIEDYLFKALKVIPKTWHTDSD